MRKSSKDIQKRQDKMRKKRYNRCQKGAMKPVNLPNRHKPTALTAYKARKKSVKRA